MLSSPACTEDTTTAAKAAVTRRSCGMPTAKGMPCQIRSAHGPCHLHRHLTRASLNTAAVPPIGAPEGQAKGPTNIDRGSQGDQPHV